MEIYWIFYKFVVSLIKNFMVWKFVYKGFLVCDFDIDVLSFVYDGN